MSDPNVPPGRVTPPIDLGDTARADQASNLAVTAEHAAAVTFHRERRRRSVGWQSRDVLRATALVLALYYGVRLLWVIHSLVLTVFLAVLFGLAVSSGVDRLSSLRVGRVRIPRGVSAALIVLSFFGLLSGFGAWMAPTLREQGAELRVRLPQAVDRVEDWLGRRQGGFLGLVLGDQGPPAPAAPGAPGAPATPQQPPVAAQPQGPPRTDNATPPSASETLSSRIGGQLSGASRYLFPFLSSTLAVITGFFIVVFVSIYIAADPKLYRAGLMHLFPKKARSRAGEVLTAIATVLRKWLVTQLIAMLVIGVVSTIALSMLNVKAALALGVLAGLLEFVPTIGPILSAVPAIAMAFLDSPEKALSVTIVYIAIQFAENQLLIPLLMKGGLDLPPAVTILAQALFTLLFGFLGLMVAVPAMAATMVAVKMLYVNDVVGDDIAVTMDAAEDDD
ncbi:MAG: AI-2E family transporter [Gemmatimonadaceae bacterium]|nr:AI-2E family transporter [Gemmatimonadaceae bacterium]